MNQPGPEALYQIISKLEHLPRPGPLDANSSPAQHHCRFDSPVKDRSTAAIGATDVDPRNDGGDSARSNSK